MPCIVVSLIYSKEQNKTQMVLYYLYLFLQLSSGLPKHTHNPVAELQSHIICKGSIRLRRRPSFLYIILPLPYSVSVSVSVPSVCPSPYVRSSSRSAVCIPYTSTPSFSHHRLYTLGLVSLYYLRNKMLVLYLMRRVFFIFTS